MHALLKMATAGIVSTVFAQLLLAVTAHSTDRAQVQPLLRPVPAVSFAPLIEKALPAVVSILVSGERYVPVTMEPGMLPPEPRRVSFKSGGSGVIVDASKGLIGTNHHVVKDATNILVRLQDGRQAPAKLIGFDAGMDIAMLTVDLRDLTSLPLGNSSNLRVGDFVIAIGNPFGLEGSASAGIVSGLMRSDIGYDIFESFIQVDAAVNPGNSGGALINLDGELIGINTAVGRSNAGSVGIAFAIPINLARRVGLQIYRHGRMRRGTIGIETRDISQANSLHSVSQRGAVVVAVRDGSPAHQVGIKEGDVIMAIDGEPVRTNNDYSVYIGSSAVGEEVVLSILTDDRTSTVKVRISDQSPPSRVVALDASITNLGGATIADIGPASPYFGQVRGVIVTEVKTDSPGHHFGIRAGDIIVSLNRINLNETADAIDAISSMAPIEEVALARQGIPYRLVVKR